jgi:adenosine deaminase
MAEGHDAAWRAWLQALPKAELHVHLDGSLRPTTLLELGRAAGVALPADEPAALAAAMHVRDARSLDDYLARFATTVAVMQSAEALERIAFELAEDLAQEGVWYVEVRFCPTLFTTRGLPLEEAVAAPLRGLRRAEARFGIRTAVILCALRHLDAHHSCTVAELALAFRDAGVVGFDLAGPEHGHPVAPHAAAFERVAREGLAITVHAGEAFGPPSIRQALVEGRAHRIGHGVRLIDDPRWLAYVRDRRIPVEICLTSNVQTRAVPDFASHPLRTFLAEGLLLSLNTDNRLMSATTVVEEYFRVHRYLGLRPADLARLALMSFDSAFLPWPEKQALLARAKATLATLPPPAAA